MMNHVPGMPGRGPTNNRYFNIRANNAQSYLNGLRAMKHGGHGRMASGKRMQFRIPGMKFPRTPMRRGMR